MSYEDYVRKNIFDPLGMSDSNANAQKLKDSPKLLTGNRNYFGFFKQGEADYPTEKSWFHEPAGYIASTPQDHAKYLRMYLNDGYTDNAEQIIKKETIDSMWYENVSLGSAEYETFYGKGWNYMEYDDLKIVFHGGQVENSITYMFILPEKKLAVCFMINANDEFVMNSLMDNAFWNSLSIIKETPVKKVHHASYVIQHIIFDTIYLLIFLLSLFVFIKAITAKTDTTNKPKVKTIVLHILGCLIWPVFLLTFSKILIDTPLWTIKSFVPDLYCVILTSSLLALTGGLVRAAKSVFFIKCYDK